jgi:hypothetical protein
MPSVSRRRIPKPDRRRALELLAGSEPIIEFDTASGAILLNVRHIVLVKRSSSDWDRDRLCQRRERVRQHRAALRRGGSEPGADKLDQLRDGWERVGHWTY